MTVKLLAGNDVLLEQNAPWAGIHRVEGYTPEEPPKYVRDDEGAAGARRHQQDRSPRS
jgi:hypothetical protein